MKKILIIIKIINKREKSKKNMRERKFLERKRKFDK